MQPRGRGARAQCVRSPSPAPPLHALAKSGCCRFNIFAPPGIPCRWLPVCSFGSPIGRRPSGVPVWRSDPPFRSQQSAARGALSRPMVSCRLRGGGLAQALPGGLQSPPLLCLLKPHGNHATEADTGAPPSTSVPRLEWIRHREQHLAASGTVGRSVGSEPRWVGASPGDPEDGCRSHRQGLLRQAEMSKPHPWASPDMESL